MKSLIAVALFWGVALMTATNASAQSFAVVDTGNGESVGIRTDTLSTAGGGGFATGYVYYNAGDYSSARDVDPDLSDIPYVVSGHVEMDCLSGNASFDPAVYWARGGVEIGRSPDRTRGNFPTDVPHSLRLALCDPTTRALGLRVLDMSEERFVGLLSMSVPQPVDDVPLINVWSSPTMQSDQDCFETVEQTVTDLLRSIGREVTSVQSPPPGSVIRIRSRDLGLVVAAGCSGGRVELAVAQDNTAAGNGRELGNQIWSVLRGTER